MKINRILSCTATAMLLLGLCACSGNTYSSEEAHTPDQATAESGGIEQVDLTVWAEEAAFDTLNKMIDSFKQEYSGQAEFNITIEQNFDSKTKDVMLADVHHAANVFPCPTTSFRQWLPTAFWTKCRMPQR